MIIKKNISTSEDSEDLEKYDDVNIIKQFNEYIKEFKNNNNNMIDKIKILETENEFYKNIYKELENYKLEFNQINNLIINELNKIENSIEKC
jgi:hypothetical protein